MPYVLFMRGVLVLGIGLGSVIWPATATDPEDKNPLTKGQADRLEGSDWGRPVDGLRAKVSVPAAHKKIGEPIPVVIVLRNEGTHQPDGSALLGPRLVLSVSRNSWQKSAVVPASDLNPQSYLSLQKGEEFSYACDLTRNFDIDVPGEYVMVGGYDGAAARRFPNAWNSGRVDSPPYSMLVLVGDRVARQEQRQPPVTRKLQETAWSEMIQGLRAKLAWQVGTYSPGEEIPAVLTIENLAMPRDGVAHLYPHIDLWARRSGWQKHVTLSLKIENRLIIKKGQPFTHSFDLAKAIDLSTPGSYSVAAGHENWFVTCIGDWTGRLQSPYLEGIAILGK